MAGKRIEASGHVRAHSKRTRTDEQVESVRPNAPQPHPLKPDSYSHQPDNPRARATPRPPNTPRPQSASPGHGLMSLLEIEREAREAQTLEDLLYVIANQTPKMTAARQAFVFKPRGRAKMHLATVTGLVSVDRTVPLVHVMERMAEHIHKSQSVPQVVVLDAASFHDKDRGLKTSYPFHAMCWLPMTSRTGAVLGVLILARQNEWQEADVIVAQRLASTFAHAWAALISTPRTDRTRFYKRPLVILAVCAALLALAIPVPMTALAPMEVVAADPFIVSAPIDGVVDEIAVSPNAQVNAGDLLVTFENTALKNQLELAEREVLVASARLKRATQLAFTDPRGRHDLGIARAELLLKTGERDYARDLAENSRIKAERSGIAIFSDKKEILGKPVAVGERIMQIATPDNVKVRIDIPLSDSLILVEGASVTLYLDSRPLRPAKATVVQADYEAKRTAADKLAYKVIATLDAGDARPPRLGVRGTAQIFGQDVPLWFYLFRKPISALRQWIGL